MPISESRCHAKLHGIIKHAQRQSRDGQFLLPLGGSDQLVGNQIARLSSLGIVVLSGVLSPEFDLNSSIVRNVLRGWVSHGDIAAEWMTQPADLSTVSCLLEACQQANVVGFYAELHSDTARRSFVHCDSKNLALQQVPVDLCAFGFPFKKRLTLFSVSVPVHLKLARQCDSFNQKRKELCYVIFLSRIVRHSATYSRRERSLPWWLSQRVLDTADGRPPDRSVGAARQMSVPFVSSA